MIDKFRMRCTGLQLIELTVSCAPNDHECNVPAITIRPWCRWNFGSTAALPALPKLDIFAVDVDEEPPEEREAEDDVEERPLDPREVKNVRGKEIRYLWDM